MLLIELKHLMTSSSECWTSLTVSPTWCSCTHQEASLKRTNSSLHPKSRSRLVQSSHLHPIRQCSCQYRYHQFFRYRFFWWAKWLNLLNWTFCCVTLLCSMSQVLLTFFHTVAGAASKLSPTWSNSEILTRTLRYCNHLLPIDAVLGGVCHYYTSGIC